MEICDENIHRKSDSSAKVEALTIHTKAAFIYALHAADDSILLQYITVEHIQSDKAQNNSHTITRLLKKRIPFNLTQDAAVKPDDRAH